MCLEGGGGVTYGPKLTQKQLHDRKPMPVWVTVHEGERVEGGLVKLVSLRKFLKILSCLPPDC